MVLTYPLAQDWDKSGDVIHPGDWGGGGEHCSLHVSATLSLCSAPAAAAPAFSKGSLQPKQGPPAEQQLLRTGFAHPREFNDTLQNAQFFPSLLFLTPPPPLSEDSDPDSSAATLNCIFHAKLPKPKQENRGKRSF